MPSYILVTFRNYWNQLLIPEPKPKPLVGKNSNCIMCDLYRETLDCFGNMQFRYYAL